MRAAHVLVGAVVLARFATVDRVPIVAVKDALIEHRTDTAQERVLATVVADVVSLTAGLFVGVHAVVVWEAVAAEAGLWHLRVGGEVSSRLAADGAYQIR